MTDNGARALAERLREVNAWSWPDSLATNVAAAILANGAAFLPDAAELDRLRRIEAAARALMATGDAASIRLVVDREAALRAALQPEGSAGT